MYTGLSKVPYFCNYFVTFRCNSKCEFCYFWRDPRLKNASDAQLADVQSNLDALRRIGVTVIDFIGGEPLLHPDLPEMLSYAKKLGFFVKVSTNGLLYEERAQELKGKISRMYLSLDATTSEEYNTIRGTDGYDQLLSSITCARDMKQDICLMCTFTNENIKNIDHIAAFAKKYKVNAFFHPCFSYFGNAPLDRSHIATIKKYFWQPYVRMSLTDLDFFSHGGNDITHPACRAGKSTIDIGPEDDLLLPCFHKCEKTMKLNGSLYSLFTSKEWNSFHRDAGCKQYCQNCSIDCYFGLSYWDKVRANFFKANLTQLKTLIETIRPH